MRTRIVQAVAGTTAVLLMACPVRNLLYLRACLAAPGVEMDVPAPQLRVEVELLLLQMCLAVLGSVAVCAGAGKQAVSRLGAATAWTLVAVGGFIWDKALDHFVGEELQGASALACLLDHRSAHTHSLLTNGPLVVAAVLAVWSLWRLKAKGASGEDTRRRVTGCRGEGRRR